jgi:dolichol-phosphate mannosyltransferase
MNTNPHISIVSPVYYGERMVAELVRRNVASVSTITDEYEIILVNDASPDNSWEEIIKQCAGNPRVKGINLSRNFGQHYAITAGLYYATGNWVVVMDCDLQDRPEEIPNLYRKAQEGFDIVYARRAVRRDNGIKKSTSALFYHVFSRLSGIQSDKAIANFGIYNKRVIEEFNKMPEQSRFFPSQIRYLGFKDASIDVEHNERSEGKSSYSLLKRFKLGFDVIVSNSNKPLRFAVGLGFGMSALSFLLALYNIIAKWAGVIQVPGYTTTVFSIWFVGGLLLLVMGIMGLYIGKIYDQAKGRQLFIVKDKVNL